MAVQAQHGLLAGVPASYEVDAQMRAMQDYGALPSAVNNVYKYNSCAAVVSGAQSDLTCNNGAGGTALASRNKRGREVDQLYVSSSSSALLPIPGMGKVVHEFGAASRMVESAMTSTSGRPSVAASSFAGAVVSELHQHNAEIDALVRAEGERMRAGLEQVRKRQCLSLVRAASAAVARRMQEKEAELEAARRRAAILEEQIRQVAAESQAWCGLARSNQAVAAGLRATLDHVLLLRAAPAPAPAEGFGESNPAALDAADDAQANKDTWKEEDATSSLAGKWACKSCGEGEASVLLLPCRHLCLCKACEPRLDACPVCLAAKNTCVVARSSTEVRQ